MGKQSEKHGREQSVSKELRKQLNPYTIHILWKKAIEPICLKEDELVIIKASNKPNQDEQRVLVLDPEINEIVNEAWVRMADVIKDEIVVYYDKRTKNEIMCFLWEVSKGVEALDFIRKNRFTFKIELD